MDRRHFGAKDSPAEMGEVEGKRGGGWGRFASLSLSLSLKLTWPIEMMDKITTPSQDTPNLTKNTLQPVLALSSSYRRPLHSRASMVELQAFQQAQELFPFSQSSLFAVPRVSHNIFKQNLSR